RYFDISANSEIVPFRPEVLAGTRPLEAKFARVPHPVSLPQSHQAREVATATSSPSQDSHSARTVWPAYFLRPTGSWYRGESDGGKSRSSAPPGQPGQGAGLRPPRTGYAPT